MTNGPDDIAAEIGAPHSSTVASNVSPEADMPELELTEVDYLNGFCKTLSEWDSSEDGEAFRKL